MFASELRRDKKLFKRLELVTRRLACASGELLGTIVRQKEKEEKKPFFGVRAQLSLSTLRGRSFYLRKNVLHFGAVLVRFCFYTYTFMCRSIELQRRLMTTVTPPR